MKFLFTLALLLVPQSIDFQRVFLTQPNGVDVFGYSMKFPVVIDRLAVQVATADPRGWYEPGIYSLDGTALCHWKRHHLPSTGMAVHPCVEGQVTLLAGKYIFAWTGDNNLAALLIQIGPNQVPGGVLLAQVSSGGELPQHVRIPAGKLPTSPWFALEGSDDFLKSLN